MKKKIIKISAIILMFQIILQMSIPTISKAITRSSDPRFEYSVNPDKTSITITKYVGTDTEVVIPNSIDGYKVTTIGNNAFYNCKNLTSIKIPDTIASIGSYAFYRCENLISINIPDSMIDIDRNAFHGCIKLTSIVIPSSVTRLEDYAFFGCNSLTVIEVDENNKNYKNVNNVLYTKDEKQLIYYPSGKQGTQYTIPSSVTRIGEGAFDNCISLTSINIPDSVISIGNYAFYGCSSLTRINIPEGVTNIGEYTFFSCSNLVSMNIPKGVTSIGRKAFSGCRSLTSINIPLNSKVQANINYEILNKNEEVVKENEAIGTGMKIKLENGEIYEIVVKGDVNGDGKISTTDITKMKKHIVQKELLQGCYEKAGNINEDTKIGVTDLANMKKALVGLVEL